MSTQQIQFDFNLPVDFSHTVEHRENNAESQSHYDQNKEHFSNQCRIIYDVMIKGERLTTAKALIEYGIGDLRRRVKDLIDFWKVPVESEFIKGKYKEYFINQKLN